MFHIIERFFIHMLASTALTLIFYYLLSFWVKKNRKVRRFLSNDPIHVITSAAILVFALFTLREPYDVFFGTQVWYKAITDQISWLVGSGLSIYGLYRLKLKA
jgi:hypothetical protein